MSNKKPVFTPVLGLIFTLSGVVCAMSFQTSISPVIKMIADANNLSVTFRMILTSVPSFGAMLLMIPAGRMLDRGNPVKLSLPFLLVLLVSSISCMLSTNTTWMLIWRLIAGFAFAPLLIYGIQLITLVAPVKSRNNFSTIQTLGAPMAYFFTAILSPTIATNLGYNFVYITPLVFAVIGIALAFYFWNIDIPERTPIAASKGWIMKESVVLAVCWGLFSMATSVFLFLGSNMAQDQFGLPPAIAGMSNLAFAIPAMIVGFIIGRFMDTKLKRIFIITIPAVLMGIFIFTTTLSLPMFVISLVLMGFSGSFIPPVVFSTTTKLERRDKIAQAIGFINLIGTFAMLISAPIAGSLKEMFNSWLAPFAYAGLMGVCICLVALSIKRSLS